MRMGCFVVEKGTEGLTGQKKKLGYILNHRRGAVRQLRVSEQPRGPTGRWVQDCHEGLDGGRLNIAPVPWEARNGVSTRPWTMLSNAISSASASPISRIPNSCLPT